MRVLWLVVMALAVMAWSAIPVDAQTTVDGPYAHCRDLGQPHRFLCFVLSSAQRDPKPCPEIGMAKIVPVSASCEGNHRERRARQETSRPEPVPQ